MAENEGVLFIFGGYDVAIHNYNDLWKWTGFTWVQITVASSPSWRAYPTISYLNGKLHVFAGQNSTGVNDLWHISV